MGQQRMVGRVLRRLAMQSAEHHNVKCVRDSKVHQTIAVQHVGAATSLGRICASHSIHQSICQDSGLIA